MYGARDEDDCSSRLFVSETEFSRDMAQITKGAASVRTVIFPDTVRGTHSRAFQNTSLASAVLNEGLERLGRFEVC